MGDTGDYVCWGASGHAKVLTDVIQGLSGRVLAYFDREPKPSVVPGVPVFVGYAGFRAWIESCPEPKAVCGVVAIGHCGPDRVNLLRLFQEHGLSTQAVVDKHAHVSATSQLGNGVQVLPFALVAANCFIGDACIINHRASVDHECVLREGVHVAPGAILCGCVSVGVDVFIGAGAIILPRLVIGDRVTIGAGAVVTKDVPSGVTVVGNPAKII